MRILAIDPGSEQSGWIVYDTIEGIPVRVDGNLECGKDPNETLRLRICDGGFWWLPDLLAIEYVHLRGMPVMQQVLDTQFWAGRFVEAWRGDWRPINRADVKLAVCGSARATDANIRQALLDLFPARGGGKTPQVGTKSQPGPLYGVKGDVWSALAIAITAAQTKGAT